MFFVPFERVSQSVVLHLSPQKILAVMRDDATGLCVGASIDPLTMCKPDGYAWEKKSGKTISVRAKLAPVCQAVNMMSTDGNNADIVIRLTKRGPERTQPCLTFEQRIERRDDGGDMSEGTSSKHYHIVAAVDVPVSVLLDEESENEAMPAFPPHMPVAVQLSAGHALILASVLGRVTAGDKQAVLTARITGGGENAETYLRLQLASTKCETDTTFPRLAVNESWLGEKPGGEGGDGGTHTRRSVKSAAVSQKELRQAMRCMAALKAEKVSVAFAEHGLLILGAQVTTIALRRGWGGGGGGGGGGGSQDNGASQEDHVRSTYGGIIVFLAAREPEEGMGEVDAGQMQGGGEGGRETGGAGSPGYGREDDGMGDGLEERQAAGFA